MKQCFIFCAGTYYGLRKKPEPNDLILAADAGYRICKKEGIIPHLVLGDFDSMEEPKTTAKTLRVPVEKDDTDTMLAVKTGLEKGCDTFYFYGGTGGKRLDHTIANLQALLYLAERGARGYLYDDNFVFTAIHNETITIPKGPEWGLMSVFCLSAPAKGVSETGVQYPLDNVILTPDVSLGVSNHILEESAKVTVTDGSLVVGWELESL